MNMSIRRGGFRRALVTAVCAGLGILAIVACDWGSPHPGACITDNCGYLCYIIEYGPTTYTCTDNMGECCKCQSTPIVCQCPFGTGTGTLRTKQTPGAEFICGNNGRSCLPDIPD